MIRQRNALLQQHQLPIITLTMMAMRKMDWKSRLRAKPIVSQKQILSMLAISRIAQTQMEKEPIDFSWRMSWSCEQQAYTGMMAMTSQAQRYRYPRSAFQQLKITHHQSSIIYLMTLPIATLVLLMPLLVLGGDSYSTHLASQLTYFSAIAYESQELIEGWSCPMCKGIDFVSVKVVSNDSNSVYGYVGYSPQHQSVIIAFRGSVDTANWILNLKTVRTSYPLCDGCSVHIGFNQGFNSVKAQVEQHINYLHSIYRRDRIMLTGHSLGGALAVMAAAYLQSVYGHVEQLYTMGQPRVGNDKFAAFMTTFIPNTFRIVHYADQVPHIPQSVLGFKHEGYEIWYERGMQKYTICPSQSKDCSNQLNVFQVTQADHKMLLYLELKVEDSYSVQAAYGWMRFWWMKMWTSGKVYNLDIETMQEEDRQIKAWIEEESRVRIISQ